MDPVIKDWLIVISISLAICGTISGVIVALLKNIFMTKKECGLTHKTILDKLDKMEERRQQAKDLRHKQDLWLVEALYQIGKSVGNGAQHLPPFPTE